MVTENLNGHAAGNGRYSQGDSYGPIVASSTRSLKLEGSRSGWTFAGTERIIRTGRETCQKSEVLLESRGPGSAGTPQGEDILARGRDIGFQIEHFIGLL